MTYLDIDVSQRNNFQKGMLVDILENEKIVRGYINKILSNENQDKGIKVLLQNGHTGRIYGVPAKFEIEKEEFKFYNLFFNTCDIFTILNEKNVFLLDCNGKKCAYLYSSKDKAINSIKNTPLEKKPYSIGKLNRNKNIIELLKKYQIDIFVIDMEKQLTNTQLNDLEMKFKNI